MAPPRVLFLHGLETDVKKSGGDSATGLRRAFGAAVWGPDLKIGRTELDRQNSVARCFLRLQEVQFAGAASSVSVIGGLARRLPARLAVGGALCPLALVLSQFTYLKGKAVEDSIHACLDIAEKAISSFQPDVVVGMSWGGGVASILLHRGVFSGPVLLLAPAGRQMASHCRNSPLAHLLAAPLPPEAHGFIVHGADDAVCPVQDSVHLQSNAAQLRLKVLPNDGHSLSGLRQDGLFTRLLDEAHAARKRGV